MSGRCEEGEEEEREEGEARVCEMRPCLQLADNESAFEQLTTTSLN